MTKRISTLLLLILSFQLTFAQQKRPLSNMVNMTANSNIRVGCSLFTNPNNYTNGSSFSFNAPTNNNSYLTGPSGANYGCMGSVPNQAWFIITVNTGGNLYFNFSNSNNYDVDAVVWGPIANNDMANACASTQTYPITCDYDAARPDLYINNAQAGQRYVMLVTNFSNVSTNIYINQPTGGSVTYSMVNLPNCSLIPTASISGTNSIISEGQSANLTLNFTGSSPWNYTLSDGTTGTTYSSSLNLTVYPTVSQTYTISSVSNVCGTNSATGSVGISVTRNTQLRSCFPLDGNANDSQGGLNSGSLQNGTVATTNRNSEANKALQFDGINDYVNIQSNQLNNGTFAFASWAKLAQLPDANNPEQMILAMGSAFDQHYLGVEYTNGNPAWKFSSNGSTVYSGNIVDTNWHLLVGVRTGGQLKIYVDGYLSNTVNTSGVATYDTPLTTRIGSSIANNKFFKGKIDDVKIFSGSLIDPEILLLLNYNSCNNVVSDVYLAVQSISTSVICTGTSFTVRAFSNNLPPDPELNFTVELSDLNGSFANPTIIGTTQFVPIIATIPSNIVGGNYKIRVRYGGTISVNTFDIFVNNPATHNITGTVALNDGQSTNLNLNFTGTGPWNYVLSNGLSGVATTSPWVISVTPDQSTNYSITSAQNVCGTSSLNGNSNAIVSVNFTKEFISCFPFNSNANDTKNNNTSTVTGPLLTENRYGQSNAAYVFDGVDDNIQYTTNLLRKREFTMSAWVMLNDISYNTQYILSQGEFSTNTFQGIAVSSYGWQFQSASSGGLSTAYSSSNLVTNQWIHLTAVRTYQSLKLYINGDLVSTVSNSSLIPFKISDIGRIGASSSSLSNFLNGKVDDVRLYKGALSDDEVFALYSNVTDCPEVQNAPIIVVRGLSPTTVCAGNTVSVSYTSTGVGISAGSPLNVVLSDQFGSFSNPTIIGSGSSSPITATIPVGIPNSSSYRIRLVSTSNTPINSANTRTLTVSGSLPTATISGGGSIQYGQNATLTINFTGTAPYTFAINNGSSQTTSANPYSFTISPFATTTYTITSLSNSCGSGTGTGSATVTVAPYLSLGSLNSSFCTGANFSVSFQANFTPTNNTFKVELSDASGSFVNPLVIGLGSSSPINTQIPNNISGGTGYKIRVVADNPSIQSITPNSLTISQPITGTITGDATVNEGQSTNLTINFTGTPPYTFSLNGGSSNDGVTQTTSLNPVVVSIIPINTYPWNITSISNVCGNGSSYGTANITVIPVPVRLVSCYPFNGNADDGKQLKNGILNGAILTSDRFGTANSAYSFNGSNSNITLPYPLSGLLNAEYTYSMWFNSNSLSGSKCLFSMGATSNVNSGNGIHYIYLENLGTSIKFKSHDRELIVSTSINNNQWYYITVVRGASTLKIYLNGGLLGSMNITGGYAFDTDNIATIGSTVNNSFSFHGKIDDVQIYKGALTDGQIQALYNNNNGCFDASLIPVLNLNSLSSSSLCRSQSINVPFSSANITNPIKVQLSDANGSFASPIQIGSGNSSPISATIPANQATGSNYKIRLVSSDAVPVISNLSTNITINAPVTAAISGTATINEGQSTNLTLNFTGSAPYTYAINNGISQTTSTNPLLVSVSPVTTTTYTITSLTNACGSGVASGNAVITVNPVAVRLVSCFPFNGNANDSKGLNNGTVYGATLTTDRFGNANSAYNFNGIDKKMQFGTTNLININHTFSLWLNAAQRAGEGIVFTIGTNKLIIIGNTLYYISEQIFENITNFQLNTWHHLVLVRNGVNIKIYNNGTLIWTTNTNSNANFGQNPMGYLGAESEFLFFPGKIDDVQIYKGALTEGQIQALYNSNDGCFDASLVSVLSLNSLSSSSLCRSQSINVPFSSANITNPIKVQLSDANGSFTSPIQIGSGNSSPILATIPANQAIGSSYKIRLVSSDAVPVISNLSTNITINAPVTAAISGTATINEGQSTNLTLNFTGSAPYTYTINNGTSQSTSSNPLTIQVNPLTTTTYTITSLSNTCGSGVASGNAVITVNPVDVRLVSCFPFNGNANDSKGLNNGTVYEATLATDRFGNANSAYYFNAEGFIRFPINGFTFQKNTISAWFSIANYTSGGYYNYILNLESNVPLKKPQIGIYMGNEGYLYFINSSSNSTEPILLLSQPITINRWYSIIVITDLNLCKIYIDGNLILNISLNNSNTSSNSFANNSLGYIGAAGQNELPFHGKIDDVQIYKGALTAGQVQALYQNQNACYDATTYVCLSNATYNSMLSGQQVLKVSNRITGSSTIQSYSNIHFDSKNSVLLQPGFETQTNTVFKATIGGGCSQ